MEFSDIWTVKKAASEKSPRPALEIDWHDYSGNGDESTRFRFMDPSATRSDFESLNELPHLRYDIHAQLHRPEPGDEDQSWHWSIRGGGEWPELINLSRVGLKSEEEARAAATEALLAQHQRMIDKGWIALQHAPTESGYEVADPTHPYRQSN